MITIKRIRLRQTKQKIKYLKFTTLQNTILCKKLTKIEI